MSQTDLNLEKEVGWGRDVSFSGENEMQGKGGEKTK